MAMLRKQPWNVLFIGDRYHCCDVLVQKPAFALRQVYAFDKFAIPSGDAYKQAEIHVFGKHDRQEVLEQISAAEFDILVSNGCPWKLPVEQIRGPQRLLLNVHPGLLPDMRGPHPVNGALLFEQAHFGASVHYLDEGIDTGAVISRHTIRRTPDLDLGLMYMLAFKAEAIAFRSAVEQIEQHGLQLSGIPQPDKGRYYRRSNRDMLLDLRVMPNQELLRRVRAFGVTSQGAEAVLDNMPTRIFDAEPCDSPDLQALYHDAAPGMVVLRYDSKLLVKTIDGLLKISRYQVKR